MTKKTCTGNKINLSFLVYPDLINIFRSIEYVFYFRLTLIIKNKNNNICDARWWSCDAKQAHARVRERGWKARVSMNESVGWVDRTAWGGWGGGGGERSECAAHVTVRAKCRGRARVYFGERPKDVATWSHGARRSAAAAAGFKHLTAA